MVCDNDPAPQVAVPNSCGQSVATSCKVNGGCRGHRAFWNFQLQQSHGRRSFQYQHDPAFEANLSCSTDTEGCVARDLSSGDSHAKTNLVNPGNSDSVILECVSEVAACQPLQALASMSGRLIPSGAKLGVTRLCCTFLFAVLLHILLTFARPVVAILVAYIFGHSCSAFCSSCHSVTCRRWTCMSVAAIVALDCGAVWAVCVGLMLCICPTWCLWWPPKKPIAQQGYIQQNGDSWRVQCNYGNGPNRTLWEKAEEDRAKMRKAVDFDDWNRISKA